MLTALCQFRDQLWQTLYLSTMWFHKTHFCSLFLSLHKDSELLLPTPSSISMKMFTSCYLYICLFSCFFSYSSPIVYWCMSWWFRFLMIQSLQGPIGCYLPQPTSVRSMTQSYPFLSQCMLRHADDHSKDFMVGWIIAPYSPRDIQVLILGNFEMSPYMAKGTLQVWLS